MNFSAVILAGGKSSRMGRDKAWLKVGGKTLLARQIRLTKEVGAEEIFISGREGVDYAAFGCRVLKDNFPNAGPLAGIESALGLISTPLLLVLAVDLPEMNVGFLRRLLEQCQDGVSAIPRVNGRIEPLTAIYPQAGRPLAEKLLRTESNSVAIFAEQCVQAKLARFVECDGEEQKFFVNWNSPEDTYAKKES